MKCKHKFKNRRQCKYPADKDGLCHVHHPELYPIVFIKDYESHKACDFIYNLSKAESREYIDKGVAMEMTYQIQGMLDKHLLKCLSMIKKGWDKKIKDAIARKDEQYFAYFFRRDKDPSSKAVKKFINKKEFTNKEKEYLGSLLEIRIAS